MKGICVEGDRGYLSGRETGGALPGDSMNVGERGATAESITLTVPLGLVGGTGARSLPGGPCESPGDRWSGSGRDVGEGKGRDGGINTTHSTESSHRNQR